jgi:hypothetical protein
LFPLGAMFTGLTRTPDGIKSKTFLSESRMFAIREEWVMTRAHDQSLAAAVLLLNAHFFEDGNGINDGNTMFESTTVVATTIRNNNNGHQHQQQEEY